MINIYRHTRFPRFSVSSLCTNKKLYFDREKGERHISDRGKTLSVSSLFSLSLSLSLSSLLSPFSTKKHTFSKFQKTLYILRISHTFYKSYTYIETNSEKKKSKMPNSSSLSFKTNACLLQFISPSPIF